MDAGPRRSIIKGSNPNHTRRALCVRFNDVKMSWPTSKEILALKAFDDPAPKPSACAGFDCSESDVACDSSILRTFIHGEIQLLYQSVCGDVFKSADFLNKLVSTLCPRFGSLLAKYHQDLAIYGYFIQPPPTLTCEEMDCVCLYLPNFSNQRSPLDDETQQDLLRDILTIHSHTSSLLDDIDEVVSYSLPCCVEDDDVISPISEPLDTTTIFGAFFDFKAQESMSTTFGEEAEVTEATQSCSPQQIDESQTVPIEDELLLLSSFAEPLVSDRVEDTDDARLARLRDIQTDMAEQCQVLSAVREKKRPYDSLSESVSSIISYHSNTPLSPLYLREDDTFLSQQDLPLPARLLPAKRPQNHSSRHLFELWFQSSLDW